MSDTPQDPLLSTDVTIAGASGFIGRALCRTLADTSHRVVALSRRQRRITHNPQEVWRQANMFNLRHIEEALRGAKVGLYLVHSMAPTARLSQGSFADLDLICADNFARAAAKEGVERIIYLGGLIPEERPLSAHLKSRMEMEEALAGHGVPVTTLRAGLIVGPGGSSSAMMLKLVQRLPVMLLPKWTRSLCQPIALDDVLRILRYCIEHPDTAGATWDIGGPDVLTYRQMLEASAKALGKRRMFFTVPMRAPKLSLGWVSLISGSPLELVQPLITSLRHNMVVLNASEVPHLRPAQCMPFAAALQQALTMAPHAWGRSPERRPTVTEVAKPTALTLRARGVVSVQRLPLPKGRDARYVARLYGTWLPKAMWRTLGLLFVVTVDEQADGRPETLNFVLRGFNLLLLRMELAAARSDADRQMYYITGGLLARPTAADEPGRFEFRTVLGRRYVLAAIHDFVPRMPWLMYKFSQALVHAWVMSSFGRALKAVPDQ